ncbi:MAG: hypothetical protein FWH21_05925, partial [Kiritimatiellaeota bacterium]|nr:hypothetical protein [Kiritimatiellota bacterium]
AGGGGRGPPPPPRAAPGRPGGGPPPPGGGGGEEKPEAFSPYVDRGIVPHSYDWLPESMVSLHPHGGPCGGMCCPCPAHAAHTSETMTLESVTANISLYRKGPGDTLQPFGAGGTVAQGEAVYAAGVTPSQNPGDALAVFTRTDSEGRTEAQTNAFTVMSVLTVGDFHGGGIANTNNIAKSITPPEWGLRMRLQDNPTVATKVDLDTFTGMTGDLVLSLEGDEGFRVWDTMSPGGTVILSPGQAVTNASLAGCVWVEAASNGVATLTYAFIGNGIASNLACSASLPVTAFRVTIDLFSLEEPQYQPDRMYLNPNCIRVGETAEYKLGVLPGGCLDDRISWNIGNANDGVVSLSYGKGETALVKGESPGDFWLEVETEEHVWSTGSEHPAIQGRVLPVTNIPVRVWIVAENDGSGQAKEIADVIQLIEDSNVITEQQFAVRLVLEGEVNVISNSTYLHLGWSWPDCPTETDLFRTQKGANHELTGLNIFFVSSLGGKYDAFHNLIGIAVKGTVTNGRVLAHEVGHACELEDILLSYEDYSKKDDPKAPPLIISFAGEVIMEEWMMTMDWANGFHPPGKTYPEIVRSLLMYGEAIDAAGVRVPRGRIYGLGLQFLVGPPQTFAPKTGLLKVGLEGMTWPPLSSFGMQKNPEDNGEDDE